MPDETEPTEDDDLDVFIAAIDAALTRQYGPDHQRILSEGGRLYSAFEW